MTSENGRAGRRGDPVDLHHHRRDPPPCSSRPTPSAAARAPAGSSGRLPRVRGRTPGLPPAGRPPAPLLSCSNGSPIAAPGVGSVSPPPRRQVVLVGGRLRGDGRADDEVRGGRGGRDAVSPPPRSNVNPGRPRTRLGSRPDAREPPTDVRRARRRAAPAPGRPTVSGTRRARRRPPRGSRLRGLQPVRGGWGAVLHSPAWPGRTVRSMVRSCWSTLPKEIPTSRRRASMPRTRPADRGASVTEDDEALTTGRQTRSTKWNAS